MTGKSVVRIRIGRGKTLPCEPLVPNRRTVTAMREARGRKLPRFREVDALMKDLNAVENKT